MLEGGVEESKEKEGYTQEERHNKKIRLNNTINNGLHGRLRYVLRVFIRVLFIVHLLLYLK